MTKFIQMLILVVSVQWFEANGVPIFQGISFQRGFEINFKPIPRKPISFIMEKWSPFGRFGRKHAIEKRNVDGILVPVNQVDPVLESRVAAPVFEHVDEMHMTSAPLRILPMNPTISVRPPPPLIQPNPVSSSLPVSSSEVPPVPVGVIITPVPQEPLVSYMPPPPPTPIMRAQTPLPPVSISPTTSNMVISPPRIMSGDLPPPTGLFTDISRAQSVKEFIGPVQPVSPTVPVEDNVVPPVTSNNVTPEPPKTENALIRGSKLALYYGNIFLQLMSQFLTNARATFDQMSNPPPIYNN